MLKEAFVCFDRPIRLAEHGERGELLNPAFRSSVGRFPIPLVHGMTMGELALLINDQQSPKAELHVVNMEGWTRDQRYEMPDCHGVMPSPNMPSPLTALVYPGTGLVEGTMPFGKRKGTTRPFELVGAPYVNGWEFLRR